MPALDITLSIEPHKKILRHFLYFLLSTKKTEEIKILFGRNEILLGGNWDLVGGGNSENFCRCVCPLHREIPPIPPTKENPGMSQILSPLPTPPLNSPFLWFVHLSITIKIITFWEVLQSFYMGRSSCNSCPTEFTSGGVLLSIHFYVCPSVRSYVHAYTEIFHFKWYFFCFRMITTVVLDDFYIFLENNFLCQPHPFFTIFLS